jgi:predicted outer membrane repeat protein
VIRDNIIASNITVDFGGGIFCMEADPVIENNLIINNATGRWGGGILLNTSFPDITNCTFSGNYADKKGGAICAYYSSPILTNCILWDDEPNEIFEFGGNVEIYYSNIARGHAGIGNIDADPLFVNGPHGAYYLSQSAAGAPLSGSAPMGTLESPCVDTGDQLAGPRTRRARFTTTRIDGVPDQGIIDMGYHYPVRRVQILPSHYTGGEYQGESAGTDEDSRRSRTDSGR